MTQQWIKRKYCIASIEALLLELSEQYRLTQVKIEKTNQMINMLRLIGEDLREE